MKPRQSVLLLVAIQMLLTGCSAPPPQNPHNICDIFTEKKRWYRYAKKASARWESTIPVIMAIMYQESAFNRFAKPPREKILWVVPGPRPSSAFGYAQAVPATWEWYLKESGRQAASRNSFGDAADFIAWYNKKSEQLSRIDAADAYSLYLAYHEGQGGFNRGSYKKKEWLKQVAGKVSRRAARYQSQLEGCEAKLNRNWLLIALESAGINLGGL